MKLGTWTVHWTRTERWKGTKRWRWLAWNALWYDRGRRIFIFRQVGFLRFDKLYENPGPTEAEKVAAAEKEAKAQADRNIKIKQTEI